MNNVNKYTNHSYKVIHLNYKLPLSDDVTVISVLLHLNGDIDTKNFSFYATQSIFSKPGNYKISLSIDLTVIDKFTILGKTDSRAFNISRMFDGYNKRFYNKTTTRRLPLLPSLGRNRVQIGDFYFDFFINCIAIYLIRLLKMFERGGRNYLNYKLLTFSCGFKPMIVTGKRIQTFDPIFDADIFLTFSGKSCCTRSSIKVPWFQVLWYRGKFQHCIWRVKIIKKRIISFRHVFRYSKLYWEVL